MLPQIREPWLRDFFDGLNSWARGFSRRTRSRISNPASVPH
jgi:hypothetical protein